jgi:hypothetical protein
MHLTRTALCCALVCVACGSTGQDRVAVPFTARGSAPQPFDADGWSVQLTRADVAMGPIYFCAARGSSADLCPSAVAEFADSFSVDALDPTRQDLGALEAVTGELHSVAWDYAITWPTTEEQPVVLGDAVNGHSARFAGQASKDGEVIDFTLDLDIAPLLRGSRAVQGVRNDATIENEGTRCELRLDADAWWAQARFDDYSGQSDPVAIEPESSTAQAVILAMTSSSPPRFVWSQH